MNLSCKSFFEPSGGCATRFTSCGVKHHINQAPDSHQPSIRFTSTKHQIHIPSIRHYMSPLHTTRLLHSSLTFNELQQESFACLNYLTRVLKIYALPTTTVPSHLYCFDDSLSSPANNNKQQRSLNEIQQQTTQFRCSDVALTITEIGILFAHFVSDCFIISRQNTSEKWQYTSVN